MGAFKNHLKRQGLNMTRNHTLLDIGSVQTALKKSRDSRGKETKPHHYVNEIRLIRYAMTGSCKMPFDLKNLPAEQIPVLHRIIRLSRRFIKLHVEYKQRKLACREAALKYETKSLK